MFDISPASVIALTVVLEVFATVADLIRVFQRRTHEFWKYGILGAHLDTLFCAAALLLSYPGAVIIIWGAAKGSMGGHFSPSDVQIWFDTATPSWITEAKVFYVVFFFQPLVLVASSSVFSSSIDASSVDGFSTSLVGS